MAAQRHQHIHPRNNLRRQPRTNDEAGTLFPVELFAEIVYLFFKPLSRIVDAQDLHLFTWSGWSIFAPNIIDKVVFNCFQFSSTFLFDLFRQFSCLGYK